MAFGNDADLTETLKRRARARLEIEGGPPRPLAFSVVYTLEFGILERRHDLGVYGAKYDAAGYEEIFRLKLAAMNDLLTLNSDGSSYRPAVWEHHEKDLAELTVPWPVTLALQVRDAAGGIVAVKCFRNGHVYDWDEWPDGPYLSPEHRIAARSPRPCPQPTDEDAHDPAC